MDGIRFSIKLTVKHIEAKNQRICLSALGRKTIFSESAILTYR